MIEPEDLYNATADAAAAFLSKDLKPWDSLSWQQKQKWQLMADELNEARRGTEDD